MMKSPGEKPPRTPKSPSTLAPKTMTSSSKKNKKQQNNELTATIQSKANRGIKRSHDSESDESKIEGSSTTPVSRVADDQIIPNTKRARVQPKSIMTPLNTVAAVRSPNKESITSSAGQKTILLGAIRKRLAELDARTLYVRKLPRNTTIAQLKTLCPTSVSSRIQTNHHANRRKHAFIEFKSEEAARAALASVDGKLIADRPIKAELCSERAARPTDTDSGDLGKRKTHWIAPSERTIEEFCLNSLYVTCIPRVATADDLRQLFTKASSFDLNMNEKHGSIRGCRVIFENEQDALEAFTSKHGTLLHDAPLFVNFAFKKRNTHRTKNKGLTDPTSASLVKTAPMQNIKLKKPEPKVLPTVQSIPKGKKEKQRKQPKSDAHSIPPPYKPKAITEPSESKKKRNKKQQKVDKQLKRQS